MRLAYFEVVEKQRGWVLVQQVLVVEQPLAPKTEPRHFLRQTEELLTAVVKH